MNRSIPVVPLCAPRRGIHYKYRGYYPMRTNDMIYSVIGSPSLRMWIGSGYVRHNYSDGRSADTHRAFVMYLSKKYPCDYSQFTPFI
jgi:hypothetical protein